MPTADDEFLQVAVESGFLDKQTCERLKTVATQRGVAVERVAVEEGSLSLEQVDAVESLRRPEQLVTGYEILSLLGQGGMGMVYRARQLAFDRVVALKMVRLENADSASLARFEQEAKTLGRISHPHIVTAFDFGRVAGRLYLAMEFLDGQDAANYLGARGVLPEFVAWHVIRQVSSGLLYAADHGVTHRDIKPANLLLIEPPAGVDHPSGVPFVKIADFGLALLNERPEDETRLTTENSTLGSPQYMAPEQLEKSHVDARADIYSLGATAFHLLGGKPPFHGLTLHKLFSRKLSGKPQSLAELRPDLSPASIAAVAKLMEKEPSDRPADQRAVLQLVDSVLESLKQNPDATSIAGAASVTLITANSPRTFFERYLKRRWTLAAASVTAMVVAFGLTFATRSLQLPAEGDAWMPTGWAVQCYDGRSLNGWRTVRGQWTPGQKDDEGALVLAGRGALAFGLVKHLDAPRPLDGYRLIALGHLHHAEEIELQLVAAPSTTVKENKLYVYQWDGKHVRWGTRRQSEGPLDNVLAEHSVSSQGLDRFHEFRVDCEGTHYRIFFDGEPLAVQPLMVPRPTEFRLAARCSKLGESAIAWFSDIVLEELAPAQPLRPPR